MGSGAGRGAAQARLNVVVFPRSRPSNSSPPTEHRVGLVATRARASPPTRSRDDLQQVGRFSRAAPGHFSRALKSQRALAKLQRVLPTRLQRRLKSLGAALVRMSDPGPTVGLDAV